MLDAGDKDFQKHLEFMHGAGQGKGKGGQQGRACGDLGVFYIGPLSVLLCQP